MFGKRNNPISTPSTGTRSPAVQEAAPPPPPATRTSGGAGGTARGGELDSRLAEIKLNVFNDLMATVDLGEFAKLDHKSVRDAISEIVSEIINMRNLTLSAAEQQMVITEICNDVLGLGPLEPLLARDDIADIMVNGCDKVYIEVNGKIELTDIR